MVLTIAHHSIPVVYLFRNKTNGKIYVGSAKNLYKRFKYSYEWNVRRNKAPKRGIEWAFQKYGLEHFDLEVLEVVSDISQLIEREQYWMDKLQPFRERGYNWRRKAGNGHTQGQRKPVSDELRQKRHEVALANVDKLRARCERAVLKIDKKTLAIVQEYQSAVMADRQNGYPECSVNQVCRVKPRRYTVGGYYWCYKDVYHRQRFVPPPPSGDRAVCQKNDTEEVIAVWSTIKAAADAVKAYPSSIRRCCEGQRKHCRGYKWSFLEIR